MSRNYIDILINLNIIINSMQMNTIHLLIFNLRIKYIIYSTNITSILTNMLILYIINKFNYVIILYLKLSYTIIY